MHWLDQLVIAAWLALTLGAGLWYSRRSSESADTFFVTDRSLPWWVVGTSMVATTFAADTPLLVSGYVASGGVAANWSWWFTGIGGIVGVFLFARLWRRSEVVTDAELVELRYGPGAGSWLRGLKAVWFGVFLNVLVIGWVMGAMRKIATVLLGLTPESLILGFPADAVVVVVLFFFAVSYTASAGLFGVIATDLLQFALAIVGAIALAILAWFRAGGLAGLQAGYAAHGYERDWETTTALLPLDDPDPAGSTAKLAVLLGVMWWAGRNADGGGYLAQRLFAARDERHALWAYLWFNVAHICLRPWPWIVVGLAGMAVLGPIDDPEHYYPRMMVEVLPPGLFGLMVASFLAAFMSTIDTQLHWGSSLLVNDLYRRFVAPDAPEPQLLRVSRAAIVGLAFLGAGAGLAINSLSGAWELAVAFTAGIGAVYIARWYWWRVNAWSEISAMVTGAVCTGFFKLLTVYEVQGPWPDGWLAFPFNALWTTLVSICVWVTVTLLTRPVEREHLHAFYTRVRPGGPGWRAVAAELGASGRGPSWVTALGILGGVAGLYGVLLGVGEALLAHWGAAAGWATCTVVGIVVSTWAVREEIRT